MQKEYLLEKAKAIDFRKEGAIQDAQQTERWLEVLYKRLPEELKW